jgi:hypothetical protein
MADQITPPSPSNPPPSSVPVVAPPTPPTALWSLIFGILSFVCCGFFTAIPAVICGHIGRSKIKQSNGTLGGMGMATAGLVLGYVALVLNLILIPTIGIPLLMKARSEARGHIEHRLSDANEVASADGNTRVQVPENWSKLKDLNDAAEIQAGNRSKDQYILVLSENKADLAAITLRKHHQITRDAMLKKMTNVSASEPVDLTINGQPALQDEITGTQEGTNIVFLHTTVEGDKHFHQILAWTSKSRWDEYKEKLREVTRTFRSED